MTGFVLLWDFEKKKQILRLTTPDLHPTDEDLSAGTPELKNVRGPVRSG